MTDINNAVQEGAEEAVSITRKKIVHLLGIYPFVSGSMIQVGIGPAVSPKMWRPILEELIKENVIKETKINSVTPHERTQVYTLYHLAHHEYIYQDESSRAAEPATA